MLKDIAETAKPTSGSTSSSDHHPSIHSLSPQRTCPTEYLSNRNCTAKISSKLRRQAFALWNLPIIHHHLFKPHFQTWSLFQIYILLLNFSSPNDWRKASCFYNTLRNMRLIETSQIELHEFFDAMIPLYAILSHRWEDGEVTFQHVQCGKGPGMAGYKKILDCCGKAASDGWKYVVSIS